MHQNTLLSEAEKLERQNAERDEGVLQSSDFQIICKPVSGVARKICLRNYSSTFLSKK